MYEILEAAVQHHREWAGPKGTVYYFKAKIRKPGGGEAEWTEVEVGKLKPDQPPETGDIYKVLQQPPDNAPASALPTLKDKDYDSSPRPSQGSSNGRRGDGPSEEYWQSQNAMKGRSAAQDRALQWLTLKNQRGELGEQALTVEFLFKTVDEFAFDVEQRGSRGHASAAWEAVGELPPVSSPASTEAGNASGEVRAPDSSASPGALSSVEVLKAKLAHKITPNEFQMMLAEAGVSDISKATETQMVGLMNRIERESKAVA
jgi:hypothetical protein